MRSAFLATTVIVLLAAFPVATLARPIEEPAVGESLVEGHTVFATIDAWWPGDADAPAVTDSRESSASAAPRMGQGTAEARLTATRTPGVLWTNDQYLTAPEQRRRSTESLGETSVSHTHFAASLAVLVRSDEGDRVREPCGGAVLAVNAGEADPRDHLGIEYALDWTYLRSYRVTDPNSHAWTVDKYELSIPQPHPVWVVNVLGAPSFVPDVDGTAADDCVELKELLDDLSEPASTLACGVAFENGDILGTTGNPDLGMPVKAGAPAWTDDPCMGYMEPSRNGFCYHGPAAGDDDLDGDVDTDDCDSKRLGGQETARRYHALLYFDWGDLTVSGAPADHSNPLTSWSTNACQSRTEWYCLGEAPWEVMEGADGLEGDSHGFHPTVPPHEESEPCLPEFGGPNPANHGGSTYGIGGHAPCDYLHATSLVEVYYSGASRPLEPVDRWFAVMDSAGDSDPFFDFHLAFPGIWP